MASRDKLTAEAVVSFCASHAGWAVDGGALVKTFAFADWGAALGFAVRVGVAAEKRDHHPELRVSWGKVAVAWSTHDAGGITALDTEMAERTEQLAAG